MSLGRSSLTHSKGDSRRVVGDPNFRAATLSRRSPDPGSYELLYLFLEAQRVGIFDQDFSRGHAAIASLRPALTCPYYSQCWL